MPTTHFSWRNSAVFTLLAALVACLGLALASAPSASAHDQLVSASPEAGAQLDSAPGSIVLRFSGELMELGNEVRVIDAQDKDWVQGAAKLDADSLTQPLQAGMPHGSYRVSWRVVSADGHPISESYSFTVGQASGDAAAPSAEAPHTHDHGTEGAHQESHAAEAPVSEAPASAQAADHDGTQGQNSGSGGSKFLPVAIGAGAGLIAYGAFVLISRARRNRQ